VAESTGKILGGDLAAEVTRQASPMPDYANSFFISACAGHDVTVDQVSETPPPFNPGQKPEDGTPGPYVLTRGLSTQKSSKYTSKPLEQDGSGVSSEVEYSDSRSLNPISLSGSFCPDQSFSTSFFTQHSISTPTATSPQNPQYPLKICDDLPMPGSSTPYPSIYTTIESWQHESRLVSPWASIPDNCLSCSLVSSEREGSNKTREEYQRSLMARFCQLDDYEEKETMANTKRTPRLGE
jgi:hypothetical protein